jgi:hypothetical protein
MAVTEIIVLPRVSIPAGTHSYGPVTVPLGVSVIQVAADRTGLTTATFPLTWALELSTDGGSTWLPWGAMTAPPGDVLNTSAQLVPESSFTVTLPAPADVNTKLRGSLTIQERVTMKLTVRTS